MAKFAKVTYGLRGNTKQYIYVVNDNVRVGDVLQPSVKHYISGKVFGTTGIAQHTSKRLSGDDTAELQRAGKRVDNIATIKTGKELGVAGGARGAGVGEIYKDPITGMHKSVNPTRFDRDSAYVKETREGNVRERETFDSYSKKFERRDQ